MTRKQLEARTKEELVRIARKRRLQGWHEMTKADLIESLIQPNGRRVRRDHRHQPAASPQSEKSSSSTLARKRVAAARRSGVAKPATKRQAPESAVPHRVVLAKPIPERDLSRSPKRNGVRKDRVVAMVRDSYWIHVYWELTTGAIERCESALGQDWYAAKPILRLIDVTSEDATNAAESAVRDVQIHGGVSNWYVEISDPSHSYRIDIGYLTPKGRFYVLARSNTVTPPKPGASDRVDTHWRSVGEDFERILARSGGGEPSAGSEELRGLFEERFRRPLSNGTLGSFGAGALANLRRKGFHFHIDAELIVYGSTDPSARVTLQGEPVPLRPDGSFTLRFSLPDGRQILPAVAATYDGIEERTIILAVERNTKELEPMIHDGQE